MEFNPSTREHDTQHLQNRTMTSVAENGSVDAKEAKTKLNATEGSKDELSELLAKYKSHIEILKSWTDVLVDDPDTESGTLYDDMDLRYVLSNAKDQRRRRD